MRLTERFLINDPPTGPEVEAAAAYVALELERRGGVAEAGRWRAHPGRSAGTISTLGALALGLTHYDRDRIHHSVLSAAVVAEWCDRLAAEPSAARAARPAIAAGREDVIVGGVVVLREVMGRFGFERCIVSETDLLDGIAASLRA